MPETEHINGALRFEDFVNNPPGAMDDFPNLRIAGFGCYFSCMREFPDPERPVDQGVAQIASTNPAVPGHIPDDFLQIRL